MRVGFLFLAALTLWAADKPADKKTAPAAATTTTKAAKPAAITLPAGAVQVSPGTYNYTDPQGKKWIYRQTPFGFARLEDKPASAEEQETARKQQKQNEDQITAVEEGDSVHFTRPGPFGTYSWKRKKTDLDETEKAVWDRVQSKNAPAKDAPAAGNSTKDAQE